MPTTSKGPGIFYICDACKPTVNPNDEDGNLKRAKGKKAGKAKVAEGNSALGNSQQELTGKKVADDDKTAPSTVA